MNGSASSESSSRNRGLAPEGAQDGVDELQDETIVYHSAAFRKERPTPESDTSQSERAEAGAAVLERHSPVRVVWPERPEHTEREPESAATAVSERQPSPPVQQSGATEQFEVEPAEPATFGVPGVEEPTEEDEANEASDDAADGSSLQLPMLEASNARCRNCRDFIPAKNGSGGFCDNPFAFEQRQSVSGETVACQSSFGSWWSPSDDWWMERADIAHHSAPTPLVNNLIRQIRSRYLEDEGSTEGQERS